MIFESYPKSGVSERERIAKVIERGVSPHRRTRRDLD